MNNSFICFGHRGAMGHKPENTLASIQKAIELGASWVEIDVYYIDNQIIVFHDDRLERTTNGLGYIYDKSFNYLRSLDAGEGEKIPTLTEVCELVNSKIGINIELKGTKTSQPVANYISELVTIGWSYERFLVSSFDYSELREVKRINENIKIGILYKNMTDWQKYVNLISPYSIHIPLNLIDEVLMKYAHAKSLKVFVYTVNTVRDIQKVHALGVDGVFTDYPEKVVDYLSKLG